MIKAAISDWAGTVLDHGSRAPMGAFVEAFAQFGVAIAVSDSRGPMGMAKRDHIRFVGTALAVAASWRAKHGRDFSETDIDAIFAVFEPLNIAAVEAHSALIPGRAKEGGANLVIDSIAELPAGMEATENRLAKDSFLTEGVMGEIISTRLTFLSFYGMPWV